MTNKFEFRTGFGPGAQVGDTIETTIGDLVITATIEADPSHHIDDDDCHNPDPNVTGCNAKQQQKLMEARVAWKRGEWFYCGIVLHVLDTKPGRPYKQWVLYPVGSLWGIECNYPGGDNEWLREIANELLDEWVHDTMHIAAMLEAYKMDPALNDMAISN